MKVGTEIKNVLVEELIHKNVDLICVLATCLLTDGSFYKIGNSHQITYITKDDTLKEILTAILFKLSKYVPRISTDKHGIYYIRVCDFDLGGKLLKLSPTYKKSPNRHQSVSDYLKEVQPTVKFLKNCDSETRKWCIRFAFSADGSVSLDKRGTAELTLRCSHPKLCFEWQAMPKEFGMAGKICGDRFSWSGVGGIRFYDKSSLRNFLNMGGFIPGVKITKKSKFYVGMEKNTLLRMCLVGP